MIMNSKYNWAVELYAVRHELEKDMAGTLRRIAAMGYKGVEFAGGFVHTAQRVKAALDDAGLVCCGWHTPWNALDADRFFATVSYFKTIGNKYAIIPGLPAEMTASRAAWMATAEKFNERAAQLAEYGIKLGYHNHDAELKLYEDGECPLTVLFDNTSENVLAQMDNGHVINGRGYDIMRLLKKYPGRFETVHAKPYSLELGKDEHIKGYDCMIGDKYDDVPWTEFMKFCREMHHTKWYIVEYETNLMPEMEGTAKCMAALKAMEAAGVI